MPVRERHSSRTTSVLAPIAAAPSAQVPPQAPDGFVKLSRSSSATLRGRSQHGRQQHRELVRRVQARVTLAATEEHGSAEAGVPPPGTGAAHRHQLGEQTEPPTSRHPRPQTPLPQRAEPAADGDENREQVPIQREKELAAQGSKEEAQQQAARSRGARPDEEPRGLARHASNCFGSAPPSPPEPPSILPAEDPPSSQAGDTPHPRHEHGDPSNPPDPRGDGGRDGWLAGATAVTAGADWPAAAGATDGAGSPMVADAAFGDEAEAYAGRQGTEAVGATGAPGTGAGGSATPPAGADADGSTRGARGPGAAGGADGTAAGADGPASDPTRGSAGAWGGVFSETAVTGFGASGRGGFVAMVALSGSAGGLATAADQTATSSGDGSGAPAITIPRARKTRGEERNRKRNRRRAREWVSGDGENGFKQCGRNY
ncbi:unnamed protein product [Closterium sp. Naga37s-1]|nr:unnamed protein product [Closterium sp. Naga37s-1]